MKKHNNHCKKESECYKKVSENYKKESENYKKESENYKKLSEKCRCDEEIEMKTIQNKQNQMVKRNKVGIYGIMFNSDKALVGVEKLNNGFK